MTVPTTRLQFSFRYTPRETLLCDPDTETLPVASVFTSAHQHGSNAVHFHWSLPCLSGARRIASELRRIADELDAARLAHEAARDAVAAE